jgi:hypothetical protein
MSRYYCCIHLNAGSFDDTLFYTNQEAIFQAQPEVRYHNIPNDIISSKNPSTKPIQNLLSLVSYIPTSLANNNIGILSIPLCIYSIQVV